MTLFYIFTAGIFGTIIGSFLNVLLFRFNTGKSVLQGRSRCMHCGHTLLAIDLVPVFSFIFLQGRCRFCGSEISWQYPVIEILAGLLSVFTSMLHSNPLSYAFWFLVWMTLLFISVYDIRHTIIPWSASLFLGILAVLSLFIDFDSLHIVPPHVWVSVAGPLLALPLFLLSLVSGGRWMGWADSVLELSLGWLLGLSSGATALMLGFWSGAFVGLCMLLYQHLPLRRKKTLSMNMHSEMPFAPFLIFGAVLAHFFHIDFFQLSSFGS